MTERERAIALYTFLNEFVQLRTKTIRDIPSYERDGQVVWATDIPQEPGCHCVARCRDASEAPGEDAPDEVWIEIRKPRRMPPPEPPKSVTDWVRREQLGDSTLELPELFEALPRESPEEPPIELSDHHEVQVAWDDYVQDHWWPWAERDRRERAVQNVYTDLFSMYQRQQRLGESFEVVFGLGFLSWQAPDGQTVQRHIVAAQVSVEFDTERGKLTVTPAGDGARPALEQDMLDPQHRPDPQELRGIEETLEKIGESVWEAGPLDGLLKSWVHSASADGEYSEALERPERPGSAPVVHLAPALILRPRTERSFIQAFQEIIDQLENGKTVPEGVSQFISVSDEPTPGSVTSDSDNGAEPGETYFPLPANDAQQTIVRRLTANRGVLVQGPPGTGKSHTIVNLICHALATGQRVLVTSHAVRALKVLRRMIRDHAPDLAPLSVVLLGDDRDALLSMEESVQGITTRQNTWDPSESQRRIANLEHDLDRDRRREAMVLADLRAIRERETERDAKFGYGGTLARIADTLRRERDSLSWVHDDMPDDVEPPLSAAEFDRLRDLLRNEQVSQWEADGRVSINLDRLPTTEAFEQALRVEHEARAKYESDERTRQRPEYAALATLSKEDRRKLVDGLRELIAQIERIERRPLPWARAATKQILGDFERTWRQLHQDTSAAATSLAGSAAWLDANPIGPEPPADLPKLRVDANALLDHLKAGRGWGFWLFRAEAVKRALYVRGLRVGGRPCETVQAVIDLLRWVDAEAECRRIRGCWANNHDFGATTFAALADEFKDVCEPLAEAFEALGMTERLSAILRGTPGCPEPDWSDRASLLSLSETLCAVETALQYEAARVQIDQPLDDLHAQHRGGSLDPVSEEIRVAIEARDAAAYAAAQQQAADNAKLADLLDSKLELLDKLTADAPKLADEVRATFADTVWDARSGDFERAWNWSRAGAWLTRLAEPGAEHQYRLALDDAKGRIARTLGQIAAEKAWAHCFDRMTENARSHLVAWSKAVRAIGKGTGKYAPLHRRNAREHLNESRSAIPAWVMPLHRVAETIKPGSELFDIAIVDEASQSGPEALLLAWLAKKLVVVGDDKQISPTYAGVNGEDVNQLREQHIAELPFADAYSVNHSFFDLAEIRYKGRIRLREHFRCMPEIIQFSNNLSYSGEPLIPLRQYGAGRLEPTVSTSQVREGYQRGTAGRAVNPPEAEAIVEEITRICGERAYVDKTVGVISLVGNAQARDIEARLVQRLGVEEIEDRQIVCGDAYAFQGDERDVMFLSMVSAPREGRRITAMTDANAQRRFNVAASRARDRLYLFHTATLSDLNPRCMRHQLLEYCLNPHVATPDVSGLDVPELERIAVQADRQQVSPRAPFDSWFEVDVFLCITRRGYRVIPQFEVASYRIDLVVQGMDGSLAVECDGDEWHGADRYEADAARQRDLERCGWTFWRVRESVFRLDPEEALSDLWKTLKTRKILPAATEEVPAADAGQPPTKPTGNRQTAEQVAVPNGQRAMASSAAQECGTHDEHTVVRQPILSPLSDGPKPVDTGGVGAQQPYVEWTAVGSVPDPRTAGQNELANLLADVVDREGPVVALRAYRLINRAAGSRRLTAPARQALDRACHAAVRAGNVVAANPLDREEPEQLVLRSPGSPQVVLRKRGPRELDELPPDEVAMLLRSLGGATGHVDVEALKRRALDRLEWGRLARRVNEFLDQCVALM